jgi:hypothetical protein
MGELTLFVIVFLSMTHNFKARAIFVLHNVSEFPEASRNLISNTSAPADPYSYPQLLQAPPDITDDMGLPRLYYVIRTVHERIDPDFAFFINDHTFVIPEHLCRYLQDKNPDQDLYAGHALRNDKNDVFNSGAAGYVLSRSTMSKIISKLNEKDANCFLDPISTPQWIQQNPGLASAKCMNSFGVHAIDTRAKKQWHRFHAFPLTRLVSGRVDEWYHNKHVGVGKLVSQQQQLQQQPLDDDVESYDSLLKGEECCSKTTISFHYVEHQETRALFATREALLENPNLPDMELQTLMIAEWPRNTTSLGFYSHALPNRNDVDGWKSLLATIRKISTRETQQDC